LYCPLSQITNLSQSALQSVHIDIPVPEPHIGSEKTPKQPFTGKKGRNLQESNRGGSLSRMDRRIDVMCTEGQITVELKHIQ